MKFVWSLAPVVFVVLVGCGGQMATTPKTVSPAAQATESTSTDRDGSQSERDNAHVVSLTTDDGQAAVSTSTDGKDAAQAASADTAKTVSDPSNPQPLDLTKVYQIPAAEFDQIESHPWRDVPKGPNTFGKIPVEIGGMICLWGSGSAANGRVYPEYVEGIPVRRKFESLYVYHCTRYKAADGDPVASLILNYKDDQSSDHKIRYGTHVRDWFWSFGDAEGLGDPLSKQVWDGQNSMNTSGRLRFNMTEIRNTRPKDEVLTIDLVSSQDRAAWCILGMTTGPAGLLKD